MVLEEMGTLGGLCIPSGAEALRPRLPMDGTVGAISTVRSMQEVLESLSTCLTPQCTVAVAAERQFEGNEG